MSSVRSWSSSTFFIPALIVTGLSLVGCGSAQKQAAEAPQAVEPEEDTRPAPEVLADVGALDNEEVDRTFRKTGGARLDCFTRGRERNAFLSGKVHFYMEVNQQGQLEHVHIKDSSVGDRATEKCLLEALRAMTWPKPMGGKVGHVKDIATTFPEPDSRPPNEWSADNLTKPLEDAQDKISECKAGSSATFAATMYVSRAGKVLSVGMAVDDRDAVDKIDCLVGVLEELEVEAPGDWAAKVSFNL